MAKPPPKTPWLNNVIIIPRGGLSLSKEVDASPLHIVNNNSSRLAFKLKTTRSHSLKPNVTCGFLDANGGCVHIRVAYRPGPKEKKLNENDRLTIVMRPAPAGSVNWEACLIETQESPCGRVMLKLKQASSPDAIGTVEEAEDNTQSTE